MSDFTNKHDNVRVRAAANALNNLTSPLTFGIQGDLSSKATPFRLTAHGQLDPTGDPTTEIMLCTAVGASSVTVTRDNPVAHTGTPYVGCYETARDWDEVQAAVNAAEAAIVDLEAAVADIQSLTLDTIPPPEDLVFMNAFQFYGLSAGYEGSSAARLEDLAQVLFGTPTAVCVFTSPLPACTYDNGASGVGATLTGNSNGSCGAGDGRTPQPGEYALITGQVSTFQNGLFLCQSTGGVSDVFVFVRATGLDTAAELKKRTARVYVTSGSTYAHSIWRLTANVNTVGTDAVTFVSSGSFIAGMFDQTAPSSSAGDLITHDGTNNIRLAKGSALQYLRVNAAGTALEYGDVEVGVGIGDEIDSATEGALLFVGASGVLAQDPTNLFWDNSYKAFSVTNPSNPIAGEYKATNSTVASGNATLLVTSTDGYAADKGGSIALMGKYNSGGGYSPFAYVYGRKQDGSDGNQNGYLAFATRVNGTGAVERMRILSDGSVGIGTTSPGFRLDVQGTEDTHIGLKSVSSGGRQFLLATSASGNVDAPSSFYIYDLTASAYRMVVTAEGNVGFGTSTPALKMCIQDSAADVHLSLKSTATAGKEFLLVASGSANGDAPSSFYLYDASASKYRLIVPSGAIGIIPPFGTSTGNTGGLAFRELAANGTHAFAIRAADAMAADVTMTLPSADAAGVFASDGAGNMSIVTPKAVMVPILELTGVASNTNWSTLYVAGAAAPNTGAAETDGQLLFNASSSSTGDEDAFITIPVVLVAGTYTFFMRHYKWSGSGIYTIYIDGISVGTIDGYDGGGGTRNALNTITSIVVTTTGVKDIKFSMETKNGSSSGYAGGVHCAGFLKTA